MKPPDECDNEFFWTNLRFGPQCVGADGRGQMQRWWWCWGARWTNSHRLVLRQGQQGWGKFDHSSSQNKGKIDSHISIRLYAKPSWKTQVRVRNNVRLFFSPDLGYPKLVWFYQTNGLASRKILYFVNWHDPALSKSTKIIFSKSIFYVKNKGSF